MQSEREYVWTKVPGGYRVVVEDRTIIYAPNGYMVERAKCVFNGITIQEIGWIGHTVDGSKTFTTIIRI